MIVGGRVQIRRILDMATVAAIKFNPVMRAFFHRLVAAGRPGKVAITAAMPKLLTILNANAPRPQAVATRLALRQSFKGWSLRETRGGSM